MAKIVEQLVTIKFSKLAKDNEEDVVQCVNNDVTDALEQVAQELVKDSNLIVEVVSE